MTMPNYKVVDRIPNPSCSQSKGSNNQAEETSSGGTKLDIGSSVGGLLRESRGAGSSARGGRLIVVVVIVAVIVARS